MTKREGQTEIADARAQIHLRMQARSDEIEQAILTRVHAISDSRQTLNPSYVEGLRIAVKAAFEHGLSAIERGERRPTPVPTELLAQARVAQRHGISIETVLRRYFGGYVLFGDYLVAESEKMGLSGDLLKQLLRTQAIYFDRLILAVSEEYAREAKSRPVSTEQDRTERVKRLLAGELIDTSELAYDFEAHHLALIASGPEAGAAIRELTAGLDRRQLSIRAEGSLHWVWLGGREPFYPDELIGLARDWPANAQLAIGEPGQGVAGWRLSHRQAAAALPLALDGPPIPVRYADVAVLASIRRDELLCTSLRRLYLEPLEEAPGGGKALRETLRAYFEAGRNSASAAAALNITRQTVNNRLRTVETHLRRSLPTCASELEIALRIEELETLPARFSS